MKKTYIFILAILATLIAAAPARAVTTVITKKIGVVNTISKSDGATVTGVFVPTGNCDRLFFGVYGNYNNHATLASLYADTASSATSTRYQRSAALGSVGGKNSWYMREVTVAENLPYTRFYLDYAVGFTGTVDYYCTYKDDGKR